MIKLKDTTTVALTDYLYEIDFPYIHKMEHHKQKIIEIYNKDIDELKKEGFLNVKYKDENLKKNLKKVFYSILHEHFELSPSLKPFEIHCYIQTKNDFFSVWHNHIHASTLAATFYLDIPKVGGEIEFGDHRYGGNTIVKPLLNKLYVFPSWMYHRPLPHYDENITRICVNLDYFCLERPKPKLFTTKIHQDVNYPFYW